MKKPAHLSKSAQTYFKILGELVQDKMRDGDEHLLAILANAYADYDEAAKVIEDKGLLLPGDTMYRQNPMFKAKQECIKTIESLSLHFGLSPKARGEKFENGKKEKDGLDDL